MKAEVYNVLVLSEIPSRVASALRTRFMLRNPEYERRLKGGDQRPNVPEVIKYYTEDEATGAITVPRGAMSAVQDIARHFGEKITPVDRTLACEHVDFGFSGELRMYQVGAAAMAMRRWASVIHAPTGSGKTVMALWAIDNRAQPTLVIVPTGRLMWQWAEAARKFLGTKTQPGLIGDGRKEIGDCLTIGVIDSVDKMADELAKRIGHLVVDECHRAPGARYMRTIEAFPARYRLGLSATPIRRDGLTQVISWLLGPITEVDRAPLVDSGAILPAKIEQRNTAFSTPLSASEHYQCVIEELIGDQQRNAQITSDVVGLTGRSRGLSLILSDRKAHVSLLAAYLELHGLECARLTGSTGKRAQEAYSKGIKSGRIKVIIATTQLVGEGWDYPLVENLFLVTPIKWEGKLIQGVGRALRPADGMDYARIIDYVDHKVPQLLQSARARARAYKKEVTQWEPMPNTGLWLDQGQQLT